MNEIVIFEGSKKDFEKLLESDNIKSKKYISFMQLVQLYNLRLRQTSDEATGDFIKEKNDYDCCIVYSDDYGSVLEHVVHNFINIITLNTNFSKIILHNPPSKVMESLKSEYNDIIRIEKTNYAGLDIQKLKAVYTEIDSNIVGQIGAKESFLASLLNHSYKKNNIPTVVLFYGPSGVGKTQTAKSLSRYLGGELTRIQFSMMQGNNAIEYVFGAEHSRASLSRDLYARETNIILIDEFDKVNSVFYNAFYELFDEGTYSDSNYSVGMERAIFILTTNFSDEQEIIKSLGMPMFSRIDKCIKYEYLDKNSKICILNEEYEEILRLFSAEDQELIKETNIRDWFEQNIGDFDNIRLLKSKLNNAVFGHLAKKIIDTE